MELELFYLATIIVKTLSILKLKCEIIINGPFIKFLIISSIRYLFITKLKILTFQERDLSYTPVARGEILALTELTF